MKLFSDLEIDKRITKALDEIGFIDMTDVQAKVIPTALDNKDIIVQSMTGSGKTAAFGVPIAEKAEHGKGIQAAIIGPTRELVHQVSIEMEKFSKHKHLTIATIYGGVSMEPQFSKLRRAEIVVGTPGRMLDHMQRGSLHLNNINTLVLDEADRMLDMGFIDDIKKIISQTPRHRQTMLFSATMPDEIMFIAKRFMNNPIKISGQKYISQHLLKHYYYDIKQEAKLSLLEYIIKKEQPQLAIIFCATRGITDYVARGLEQAEIQARPIHGGMSQASRMSVLDGFHRGQPKILVATDVAARGLDIQNVSHVLNYDIPKTAENFTHRIGRTARFGKKGTTISLLSKQDHDSFRKIVQYIDIEKLRLPEDFVPKISYVSQRRSFDHSYNTGFHRKRFGERRSFNRRRFSR